MPVFSVPEVRPATDADAQYFRDLVDGEDGWQKAFSKGKTTVSLKQTENTSIKLIKVMTHVDGLPAAVMYDTLHDPEYRKIWDKQMIKGYDMCLVSPNTDIGYYSMHFFPPFKNRDFVTLRSWFAIDGEYIVINHSVFHRAAPPQKNLVRALSYLTGFLVRTTGSDSCLFCFVTQCDPRGNFPAWAVNRGSQFTAPMCINKLIKHAKRYPQWKAKNAPHLKPWLFPEQHTLPLVNWDDISQTPDFVVSEIMDESSTVPVANGDNVLETVAAKVKIDGDTSQPDTSDSQAPCATNGTVITAMTSAG